MISNIHSVRFKIDIVLCGELYTISFSLLNENQFFMRLDSTFHKLLTENLLLTLLLKI